MNTPANRKIEPITLATYVMHRYKSLRRASDLQHLKLQKLLYYIQAWHLTMFDEPLFEEDFQAWLHGPVLPSVWDKFKDLDRPLAGINLKTVTRDDAKAAEKTVQSLLVPDQIQLIDDVLKEYGPVSGYDLELLTHSEDPWMNARKGVPPLAPSKKKISKEDMRTFYKTQFNTLK